jgi:hypothetical protein
VEEFGHNQLSVQFFLFRKIIAYGIALTKAGGWCFVCQVRYFSEILQRTSPVLPPSKGFTKSVAFLRMAQTPNRLPGARITFIPAREVARPHKIIPWRLT